jgi:hypothetical protein
MRKSYRQSDLDTIQATIDVARTMWCYLSKQEFDRQGRKDWGSAIIGDGIGIMFIAPRCRTPRLHLIISAREVQFAQGCAHYEPAGSAVVEWLQKQGVDAFYVYGRMD